MCGLQKLLERLLFSILKPFVRMRAQRAESRRAPVSSRHAVLRCGNHVTAPHR